jgi:hypothetical protein
LCGHMSSFLLGVYPEVELLDFRQISLWFFMKIVHLSSVGFIVWLWVDCIIFPICLQLTPFNSAAGLLWGLTDTYVKWGAAQSLYTTQVVPHLLSFVCFLLPSQNTGIWSHSLIFLCLRQGLAV